MAQVTSIRVPTLSRPRAEAGTVAVATSAMWWRSATPQTVERAITPAEALKLLDRASDVNRPMRQAVINQYARHMMIGTWKDVSQQCDALAFDVEGRCINGQHRLWAVVESGKTITFTIKLGLPTSAIDSIDDHLSRSDADVYAVTRAGNITARHMAVATRMMASAGKPRGGFDRAMKFDAMSRYRPMVEKAMELVPPNKKIKGFSSTPLLAVLARATHTVQLPRLQRFVEVLKSGMAGGPEESAAILLRDWLLRNGCNSGSANELYWKTERALRAFLDHDQITTLYVASVELFPLPGEATRPSDLVKHQRERVKRKAEKKR